MSKLRAKFALFALLVAAPLYAQSNAPAYPDDSWIPQGMEVLAHHATFHTDFTFDKSMLDMANGFVGDDDTRRIVAKLRGISVHSYRFSEPGLYDPRALEAVRQQYRDRGWQHMVANQSHPGAVNPSHTDVWVRFEHANIEGFVILIANETNLNLVAVNGTISPLDLLHLRGHFGIPRFSGDQLQNNNDY
jgi:hypothetical protein